MKISISLFVLFCVAFCVVEARAKNAKNFSPMLTKKHNKHTLKQLLAKKPDLWKAQKLSKAQQERFQRLSGTHDLTEHELAMVNKTRARNNLLRIQNHRQVEDLPKEFDARKKWPNCPSISDIQDQSRCGSCWAVASASVLTDRACIQTNGRRNPVISATDLLACCTECYVDSSDGCQGGSSYRAWTYIRDSGVVSGGKYGSGQGCKPYVFASYVSGFQRSPQCSRYCQNGQDYQSNKHYGYGNVYPDGMRGMMNEIYNNGPIAVSIELYRDLYDYRGGIYYHRSGPRDGGHLIRMIGWGEDNGVPYWLAANSWGNSYGENGLVRIIRGVDNVGVETRFSAASSYDESRSSYY